MKMANDSEKPSGPQSAIKRTASGKKHAFSVFNNSNNRQTTQNVVNWTLLLKKK